MITITRKMEFDAGHRVLGHEGKCQNLHGHRYVAELTVRVPKLDDLGRVIDFGVVKEKVGGWIDGVLDHNMLFHPDDPMLHIDLPIMTKALCGREPFVMPDGENPTAENIAKLIALQSMNLLGPTYFIVRVRIYETPNCWADWTNNATEPTATDR